MDLHQFFAASSPGSRGASAPKLGPLQKFTFFPFSLLFFHLHLKREGGKKEKEKKSSSVYPVWISASCRRQSFSSSGRTAEPLPVGLQCQAMTPMCLPPPTTPPSLPHPTPPLPPKPSKALI